MKNKWFLVATKVLMGAVISIACCAAYRMEAKALTLEYDAANQEVIVAGVPATNDSYNYSVNGRLYYGDTLVESFCYGTAAVAYHIPSAQAYIFSYADKEFILPGSGEYVMKAWIETMDLVNVGNVQKSQQTSLTFNYQKKDESTNWGPGFPETMVEDWEVEELSGTGKDMVVTGGTEPHPYTWTINGADIYQLREENQHVNLEIVSVEETFDGNVAGDDILDIRLDIAHSGDFGFTAKLDYTLGTAHAGKYANLFYVLEPGKYEFVESCQIDGNGVATFSLNHASSYYIVVREEAYVGEAIVVPAPAPAEEAASEPETEPGKSSSAEAQDGTKTKDGTASATEEGVNPEEENSSAEIGGNVPAQGTADTQKKGIGPWGIVGIVAAVLAAAGAAAVFFTKKKKQ